MTYRSIPWSSPKPKSFNSPPNRLPETAICVSGSLSDTESPMSQAAGIYHKRLHKLAYYTRHSLLGVLPHTWLARNGQDVLREFSRLNREQQQALHSRVDYYNRLSGTHTAWGKHCRRQLQKTRPFRLFLRSGRPAALFPGRQTLLIRIRRCDPHSRATRVCEKPPNCR